jgi:hypothetical protein
MPTPDSLLLPNLRKLKNLRNGGPGRMKGLQNKITRDLKLSIVEAAALHGGDGRGSGGVTGYCLHLATNHPKAFATLIGRMLPYQVDGTIQSVVEAVRIISIPADHYLDAESMAKLKTALMIEHASIEPEIPETRPEPDQ